MEPSGERTKYWWLELKHRGHQEVNLSPFIRNNAQLDSRPTPKARQTVPYRVLAASTVHCFSVCFILSYRLMAFRRGDNLLLPRIKKWNKAHNVVIACTSEDTGVRPIAEGHLVRR